MTFSVLKRITALIMCVLLLSGCSSGYKGLDKPLYVKDPLAPVVSDGGIASRQGEWIYYINGDNFTRHEGERFTAYAGALCRMKSDGSEKTVVLNKDVSLFNIFEGRIYVLVYEGGSVIASLKIDGTDYKVHKTVDDIYYGGCYGFSNGYIYYTEGYKLYRLDKNGKNSKRLTDFSIYNLSVSGDYVYFTKDVNGEIGNVYKIKNGSDDCIEVTNSPAYVIDVKGDKAYYYVLQSGTVYEYDGITGTATPIVYGGYTDYLFNDEEYFISYTLESENDEAGIYRIPAGGGAKERISENSGSMMQYHNGYLYYVNVSSLNMLFRVKADGTGEECVSEEFVYGYTPLDIVDDHMYFISDSDYDMIYRVSLVTGEGECIEYEDIAIVG